MGRERQGFAYQPPKKKNSDLDRERLIKQELLRHAQIMAAFQNALEGNPQQRERLLPHKRLDHKRRQKIVDRLRPMDLARKHNSAIGQIMITPEPDREFTLALVSDVGTLSISLDETNLAAIIKRMLRALNQGERASVKFGAAV